MKASSTIPTLWITFVSLLVATIVLAVYHNVPSDSGFLNNKSVSDILVEGIFGGLCAFFIWGLFFWPTVLLVMSIIEYVTFRFLQISKRGFLAVMTAETVLISIPFLYAASAHEYPEWYYYVSVFVLSQLIRIWRIRVKYTREFIKTYVA